MNELRIWLDQLLSKVTMYRLVIYGLIAIDLWALVLMLTGYLPYSWPFFLASIVVLVGASYVSNKVIGWLFGIQPYAESAIITGLILALLFMPPITKEDFVRLCLVATFASLSKYLFAVRGKHIFNPAAIAAVIASIAGLSFATWWVATPALLPITAVVAFLILYKIEKIQMALTFLAVAVAMIVLQSVLRGVATPHDILLALSSWPLVFFAGVMLSEPLTLAPRRKQQMIVAAVVGVLVTTDFHYASISMTPALALVIGNALSFWYGVRRGITLRLVTQKRQGSDGHEFVFDVSPLKFQPGQYLELTLPHPQADSRGIRRVFSIVGRPGDEQLAVAMRIPEKSSTFKKAMLALKPGQKVHATRVAGDFVLPADDLSAPVMFIAGGIGITPFISFLQSNDSRQLTLLYAVNSIADIMFLDQLKSYNVKVVIISPDDVELPDSDWVHESGRINGEIIKRYLTSNAHVYVSGPPGMVTAAKLYAQQAGAEHVHTDLFSGY